MSEIADRYDRLAAAFAATIDGVADDQWTTQTGCEAWTARDVVRHVVETHGMFEGFVGRELGDVPSVDDDPAAAFAAARAVVAADLRDPEKAGVTFQGFSGETSFEGGIDRFIANDLLVHRWDLADAIGGDGNMDPAEIQKFRDAMEGMADKMRGPGAFGPELEPPEGADEQTRLLAFLGRKAW